VRALDASSEAFFFVFIFLALRLAAHNKTNDCKQLIPVKQFVSLCHFAIQNCEENIISKLKKDTFTKFAFHPQMRANGIENVVL